VCPVYRFHLFLLRSLVHVDRDSIAVSAEGGAHCFDNANRRSERRPSVCVSVISRTSSFWLVDVRRTNLIASPALHWRRISTVWLSRRREDWVPVQSKSWKSRAAPSK